MKIKIKKLHPNAIIPKYAKPGDAGLDLTAISLSFSTKDFIEYDTGLAVEIPEGHVGLVFPRSSISDYGLRLCNSVGVMDAGYRNSIKLRFKTDPNKNIIYKVGDRVGQLMILPYPQIEFEEADELTETERGGGGFGSSGKSN